MNIISKFYLLDACNKRVEVKIATQYFEQLYLLGMQNLKGFEINYLTKINIDSLNKKSQYQF